MTIDLSDFSCFTLGFISSYIRDRSVIKDAIRNSKCVSKNLTTVMILDIFVSPKLQETSGYSVVSNASYLE